MGTCTSVPVDLDDSVLVAPGYSGERVDVETFIDGAQDTSVGAHRLHVVSWLPVTEPRAIVLVCHGLHEHALRYYGIAHRLTALGVAVYGCDHYAHGRSDGERGLITDYKVLVEDFVKFAGWARARHPGVPASLLGHSMGSVVAALCVNRVGPLRSVLFSANPIHPGPGAASPQGIKALHSVATSGFGKSLTGVLAALDPKGPAAPIDLDGITEDPEERAILLRDPHRYGAAIRNLTASEILRMIAAARAEYKLIKVPFFCMHGTLDTLARTSGSRELYMSVSTPWRHRNITIYTGLRHELFHEAPEGRERCLGDAVAYFDRTLLEHAPPVYRQESSEIDVSVM